MKAIANATADERRWTQIIGEEADGNRKWMRMGESKNNPEWNRR